MKLLSSRQFNLTVFLVLYLNYISIDATTSNISRNNKNKSLLRRRHAILYAPYCKFDTDIIADDKLLAKEIAQADYVFSGKVTSEIQRSEDNATLVFNVLVKRYFKHPDALEGRSVVRVAKTLRDGEGVKCRQVVRFRFTAIFVGRKPQDHHQDENKRNNDNDNENNNNNGDDDNNESSTRTVDIHLSISPVQISLGNLDRVNAATKDVAYKPRNTIIEETCEKTFCAWGAQCVTGAEGKALCQCPTHCRPHGEPVCGSDGRTYDNHCQLRVASCRARLNTKVLHVGKCEQSDPCKDKQCGFGARCVPSPDGHSASCQCPDKCPNYGDHSGSRPVCGSDGVDYKDQCSLRRAACRSHSNITVKFSGKCDPCAGVQCSEPEICQLNEHRNPVCRCGDTCPLEFTPVCGSDGKTYSNECSLKQEACRTRKTLNIIYRGKCSSGANPCTSVRCTLGEECTINKFGIARCECPPACEPIMRPVCSKDGRTYPSECELQRSACIARVSAEVAYAGVCGGMGPCSEHECKFGATCVERSGKAHCECPPVCSAEFEPVCGSDGISYGNECKLRREACIHRREISVLYQGPCNGCESKKCDFYAVCESDGSTEGRCVCPQACRDEKIVNATVCGTDGITYNSECQLRIASCKAKQYILTAYKGNCDLCLGVECKYGARCEAGECVCPTNCEGSGEEPVCASNMMTFPNECEMQKAGCLQTTNQPLSVVFYGDCRERFPIPRIASTTTSPPPSIANNSGTGVILEAPTVTPDGNTGLTGPALSHVEKEACRDIHCDFEATCELGPDNFPRCACQFDCASAALLSSAKPVCASDLRIYPSICAMKMEACQRQEELRLRPLDLCQGMEVKPCNGGKPIKDPSTGQELDCGNGARRQDCPSGSYCHQTTRFARCCYKDQGVLSQKSCEDSWFGCCPDGKTAAQGPDNAGCPSMCGCNKLGSYSETCDPGTQQCKCRPGVGGDKCDRCEPGYWGLPKISSGHHGCIPCGCSTFGSVRDDCEQMTGRCVCNPGIQGQKCTVCTSHDKVLGPNGCVSADLSTPPPSTCKELTCHFGATCFERGRFASCECNFECAEESNPQIVCGSDGQTYATACKLRQVACKFQKDIVVQAFGTCKDDVVPGTDWPLRRYTPLQFTQSDDSNSPLSKSTRHLLVPDPRFYYDRRGSLYKNSFTIDTGFEKSGYDNNHGTGSAHAYNTSSGGTYAAVFRPTPATVRVITALLGDLCSENSDCLIMYSNCIQGACTCLPDYSESLDRQECLVKPDPTDEYHACSSAPCMNEGKCVDLPSATFTCICDANYTGSNCESKVVHQRYEIPAFDGYAYARLKPLKAYHKLSIEIEFKTYANDGIILYNQQKEDGHGDFVSLAIVNGFIDFRYNLGDGVVAITSLDKVELNKFHRVIAKRYHKDGMLQLDDGENVAGQSSGTLRALDLVRDTFVGFVPTNYSRIYENIGVSTGLKGCIKKFKVGRRSIEMQEHRDEWVVKTKGLRECGEDPCSGVHCQNGGQCQNIDIVTFRCDCLSGFIGTFCEASSPEYSCLNASCKSIEAANQEAKAFATPEFTGSSFLQFPKLEGISKKFSIEVSFLSRVANGLILYNGQMKNANGDFISLALVRGHVQFRFNLGSGIANITSKETITTGQWHWVRIYRNNREGVLQLDNNTVVRGHSGAPLTELNLELPFYIGSVISWPEVHRLAGVSKGFKGAIQKILLNGSPLPISDKMVGCSFAPVDASGCGFEIGSYDGLPCPKSNNPCLNNGICISNLNVYTCQCQAPYEGLNCESFSVGTSQPIKFTGDTYLQYKNRGYKRDNISGDGFEEYETLYNEEGDEEYLDDMLYEDDGDEKNYDTNFYDLMGRKGERANRYDVKLRTFVPDGLVLWRSKNKSIKDDYFAIAIVDGYPEVSYNLGRQKSFWTIRSKTRVDDGQWHTIHVRRRKRVGFIAVDNGTETKGVSESGSFALSTNSKLWIGGSPSLPSGLPLSYYGGFDGCIQYVHSHTKPINMIKHSDPTIIKYCNDNEI